MVPIQDERVIEAMERYGGGFVQALAQCARHADVNNYLKIKLAFAEYFDKYRQMANK